VDWGSLTGIVLAFGGIIAGQVMEGGHPGSLLQPAAFIIVAFGTLGAVIMQSGLPLFLHGAGMARHAFLPQPDNFNKLLGEIILWSATARREGLLSLERFVDASRIAPAPSNTLATLATQSTNRGALTTRRNGDARHDGFMQRGLRLLVDGVDPDRLRSLMESELSAWEMRERSAIKVWDAAGGYAPTVGILGAVLGLIHVMENLSDPSRLGSGIAVAFVATIYGVGLANLVFLPIAGRLKLLVGRETFKRELLIEALVGIATGENPRMIEDRLAVWLK
jgi:chemotaxis protein MotA